MAKKKRKTKQFGRSTNELAPIKQGAVSAPPELFPIESQAEFLTLIEGGATVTEACTTMWLERHVVYRAIRKDPKFSVAYDEASKIGLARVEDELHLHCFHRRAGDVKAILSYLAGKDSKWKPTYRGEISGPNGKAIVVDVEKRAKVISEILDLSLPYEQN